ncbi:hypothetical protein ACGRHY_24750 [Streptomyces sp. HK10]|uniref:hypothetical protein n=1 Tax=Streptomyces sp. HK10 TaxID=3373255 RepID=UPI0037485E22
MDAESAALETGWKPTTPVGDTLTRRYVYNHADCVDAIVRAAGGRTLRTDAFAAADLGRPSGLYNSATLLQPLAGRDTARALAPIEEFFGQGTGQVLLWSPWPTPDLTEYGWKLSGHPPLLLRPPGEPPSFPDRGTRVVPVEDAEGVRAWERTVVEGFPFDDVLPLLPGALLDPAILGDERFRMWLALKDGVPASAAALFTAHGIAQFVFGVTLPRARREGHWYALVRERLKAAGPLPSAALFSDDSRPGAERAGFLPLSRFTLWYRDRP